MRLIDADVLKAVFEEDGHLTPYIEEFIDACPTVEAVEVVRCRNCKYWSGRNDKPHEVTVIGYCHHRNHLIMPIPASWYCADGKRRMKEDADDNN